MKLKFIALAMLAGSATFAGAQHRAAFFLTDAAGGESFTTVLNATISRSHQLDETTSNNLRTYRPGRPVFGNITFEMGMGDRFLDDWLNAITDGKVERRHGGGVIITDNDGTLQRYNFFECWPCRWSYPACDANGGKPSGIEVEICGTFAGKKGYDNYRFGKEQKKWMPSNFRLKIDGLDEACKRVNKIEAIAIKQQSLGDFDGDGQGDYTASDLVFTVPASVAGAVNVWFEEGGLRNCTLDYLDNDGSSLRTVGMQACVYRVSPSDDGTMVTYSCAVVKTKTKSNQSND